MRTFQNVFCFQHSSSKGLEESVMVVRGRIENFVTRVTVQHHEACRVMTNSYSE